MNNANTQTQAAVSSATSIAAALLKGVAAKTKAPVSVKTAEKKARKVSASTKTSGIVAEDMIAATNYAASLVESVGTVNAIRQFTVANPMMERKDVLTIFVGIGLNAGTIGRQYQEARKYGVNGRK